MVSFDAVYMYIQLTLYRLHSSYTGRKISSIINKYCKDLNVRIIFSPFKLSTMFSPKDFVPDSLKSRVVYQFTCASCGARYIGQANIHFSTRANEHLFRDKNSHSFKHISASKGCRDKCDVSCLVKPIDILAHVLMSISFGKKIPTVLNISVLLKVVGISVMFLVLIFSIMLPVNSQFKIN